MPNKNTAEFERLIRTPYRAEIQGLRRTSEDSRSASPSLMMLVLLAVIGVLLYASFLFTPGNRGDLIPYLMVITAESIIIAQCLLSLWTIISSGHNPRGFEFHHAQYQLFNEAEILASGQEREPRDFQLYLHEEPLAVDVFITTYGEDLGVIRKTVEAALALHGAHRTHILDDGRSDGVRRIATELGAEYISRADNSGAKAGNINNALGRTTGDLFAVFDADFVPRPNFLYETLPFFADENVAFVQTPQHYGNLHTLISRGAGYMQTVFYSLIQPGKNRFNAAFCVGTNVVFRRTAIDEIGGMYQGSKSEDVWTSLLLHEKGWKSVYIPTVLAVGQTPETIEAYSKQQLRWATGGFEILLRRNPLRRNSGLTIDQKLQYLGTSTFYFNGIAPMLLLAVPPLHIYLNLTPVNLNIGLVAWTMYYSGFYVMQVFVAFYTIGSFRYETLLLASASFPIYLRALWNAAWRREQQWHVTGTTGRTNSPFNYITAQVLCFVFLLGTSAVGLWKAQRTGEISLSLFWNSLNALILGAFVVVALMEARSIRKGRTVSPHPPDRQANGRRHRVQPHSAPGPVPEAPVAVGSQP